MSLGIIVGYILNRKFEGDSTSLESAGTYLNLLSKIFLRMIKMIIGPLIFSILTVGIAKLGDFKLVGRIGAKTLGYFYFAYSIVVIDWTSGSKISYALAK